MAMKRRFTGFSNARRVKRRGGVRRAAPRRRAQRRFTKRAGWAVGRSSQAGAVQRTGYNTRRLPLSAYRNALWSASRFKTHWRSTLALSGTVTTPANIDQKQVVYGPAWGGGTIFGGEDAPFWRQSGGLQEVAGEQPFGRFVDITIRGGRFTRRYVNTSNTTVRVERWEMYRKPNIPLSPIEPFALIQGNGWDPTYLPDFQNRYRIGRKFTNDIEPGDTFTVEQKIPIQKVDQDIWVEGGQRAFIVTAVSSAVANQEITIQYWFSCSFAGDRTDDVDP